MAIRIPIEISTEESTEIRELLDRIERADEKLSGIRTAGPARPGTLEEESQGRQQAATGIQPVNRQARAATGPQTTAEKAATTPLGTPLDESRDPTLPKSGVRGAFGPASGQAPEDLVRQNQFKALQEDVGGLEQKLQQGLGIGGQAVGLAALASGGGAGAFLNKLIANPAIKAAGIVGIAITLAITVFDMVVQELIRPGGLLDRRFKRNFETEYNLMRSREVKGQIRAGLKEIRISTGPIGVKATGIGVTTTLSAAKAGNVFQKNKDLQFGAQGVP